MNIHAVAILCANGRPIQCFLHCSNHEISIANFVIHETFCYRNIVTCQLCHEPVREMASHFNEVHKIVPCEKCYLTMEIQYMEIHLVSDV